jgi:hypothetical protein
MFRPETPAGTLTLPKVYFKPVVLKMPDAAPPTLETQWGRCGRRVMRARFSVTSSGRQDPSTYETKEGLVG